MDQEEMDDWVEEEEGEYSNVDENEEDVYAIQRQEVHRQEGYTTIGPKAWRERKAAKEVARIQKLRDRAKRKAKVAYRWAKEEELH
jgi:hypothetical protein